jgi:hypothetical protein
MKLLLSLAVAVAASVALVVIGPGISTASAATSYGSAGSFGAATLDPNGGTTSQGMAVDDATGQVLVVDVDRVKVYAGSGSSIPDFVTDFGSSELSGPASIAIDQSSGAIYVGDAGNNRIAKYTSDHAATPTFTLDMSYFSPSLGSGPGTIGDFSSPLAVDPRNGDLLVADKGNHVVSRFSASGAFLGSFDGADSGAGTFHSPASIAVDGAGEIYVVDATQSPIPNGASVVEPFTAVGVADGSLTPMDGTPSTVTYDSKSGNVLVVGRNLFVSPPTPQDPQLLYVFHGGAIVTKVAFPAATAGQFVTAAAVDESTGRFYALTRPYTLLGSLVQVFDPIVLPDVSVGAPTGVTTTHATFRGTLDPLGIAASYHFEYSSDGGTTYTSTPDTPVGTTAGPVEQAVTGLEPNQAYLVRLVGTNANGSLTTFVPQSFSTAQAVPDLTTEPASGVDENSATLHGTVNPHGLQTTFQFQYGTTTDYGRTVPADHADVAGGRHGTRNVQEDIAGLVGATTYHYRIVATNSVGTAYGADRVFTTSAPIPQRTYELVSPVAKGGANVNTIDGFQSSPDGNVLAYLWKTAPGGDQVTSNAPVFPRSVATRGGSSWTSVTTDPPQLAEGGMEKKTQFFTTLAVSSDGTRAVVATKAALAPGGVSGDSNIYMRDNTSGAYTTMLSVPGINVNALMTGIQGSAYVDGTSDFSHVLIGGLPYEMRSGDPIGALYEWAGGRLRLVSIDQNGAPFGSVAAGTSIQLQYRETPFISSDGSVIAVPQNYGGGMYVRVGDTTYAASASRASADPGTVHDATYAGMSADGHYLFFYSHDLTDGSDPGVTSLYRFDVRDQGLDLLTAVGKPDGWLQTSANGDSVWFLTDQDIASGSTAGSLNIDVWHQGTVHHIATLDPARNETGLNDLMGSPNGRYFAFTSYSRLTSYDNSSSTACVDYPNNDPRDYSNPDLSTAGIACREVYRYDVGAGTLTCASCRPDGGRVTGDAVLGPNLIVDIGGHHFPRAMLDDGQVFFDTPDPLSARDSNAKRDVYSFDGDQVTLISTGKGSGHSQLGDVSADGRDVFFTTEEPLVPVDKDTLTDVYDARIGGGLSSQSPDPVGSCKGDDCHPQGSGPVTSPAPSSQNDTPVKKKTTTSSKAKVVVSAASFEGTILRLTVSVSGSGRIRVAGTKLTAATRSTSKAGIYHLRVPLTKHQRALRRAGHKVKTAFTVTMTPAFGTSVKVKLTRTAAR